MRLLRRGNRIVALRADNGLVARTENGPCCCGPQDPGGCCNLGSSTAGVQITGQGVYSYRIENPNGSSEEYSGTLVLPGPSQPLPGGTTIGYGADVEDDDARLGVAISRVQTSFPSFDRRILTRVSLVFSRGPGVSMSAIQENTFVTLGNFAFPSNTVRFTINPTQQPAQVQSRTPVGRCNPSDAFAFDSDETFSSGGRVIGSISVDWDISGVPSVPCP